MKVKDLLEELQESTYYQFFKEKHPNSFFTAAFLILDLQNKTEEIQLDYFLEETSQVAAFSFPWNHPKLHDNIISVQNGKTTPKKIESMSPQTTSINLDIDDLEEKCNSLIKENGSSLVPTKIIAILKDGIWNLTLMDNMLGIVRIKINAITKETTEFNKGGLMDFMGIKKK